MSCLNKFYKFVLSKPDCASTLQTADTLTVNKLEIQHTKSEAKNEADLIHCNIFFTKFYINEKQEKQLKHIIH